MTVSGPPISLARTGPPPESRFAPAIPDTVTGPPSAVTVAVTSDGTITEKLTSQSELAHAGSPTLRRPSDTDCATGADRPPADLIDGFRDLDVADGSGRYLHRVAAACTARLATGCGTVTVRVTVLCGCACRPARLW